MTSIAASRKYRLSAQAHQSGFTLIEILIAIFIFSWIAIGSYQILDQISRAADGNKAKNKELRASQRVSWQLAKDFRQMVNVPVVSEDGDLLNAVVFDKDETVIEFTRLGWSNPVGWRRSEMQRVAYTLDIHPQFDDPDSAYYGDEDLYLIRKYWPVLDRVEDTLPVEQALVGGVEEVVLRFWDDGNGDWFDEPVFVSPNKPYQNYQRFTAVEMTILLENDEILVYVFKVS